MAEQPPPTLTITYPTPPPFYKEFTPENIARIEELRAAQAQGDHKTKSHPANSLPVRILDLPPELRCLQPPEPPADGFYRCFGIDHTSKDKELVPLEVLGFTQLYTPPSTPTPTGTSSSVKHHDRAFILKRLAKSLLLNYLEMAGIMSIDPSQYEEKLLDIKTLNINFHHLLNEYRPHQARESLILMMQDQLERSRAETEGIMRMKAEVEALLEGLGAAKLAEEKDGEGEGVDVGEQEEREVWEEVWRRFG